MSSVFPLIMNAVQYYIIDSFIKDQSQGHDRLGQEDSDAGSGSQQSYHSIDVRDSMESQRSEDSEGAVKEAREDERLVPGDARREDRRPGSSDERSPSTRETSPHKRERLKDA